MKMKIVIVVVMVIVAVLMVASVALAASSTTTTIIQEAQAGHIDGNYTAAQVEAALAYVKGDPTLQQYSTVEGVLEDYLASLPAPAVKTGGVMSGGLMFTGGSTVALLALGLALMSGGLVLRRRHA
jgi:hypothetical protein